MSRSDSSTNARSGEMSAVSLTGANGDASASGSPRATVSSMGVVPPTLISSASSGRRTGVATCARAGTEELAVVAVALPRPRVEDDVD